MSERTFQARTIWTWLRGPDSPKMFLVIAAIFMIGGTWLFIGVLEDVVNNEPLVKFDAVVYQFLQERRSAGLDQFMVGVTELGDVQVLLPVIVVALLWFGYRRMWQTALYWLLAVGVAELLVKVLKFAVHRARPGSFYTGVEQFSFPSSHALMSTVVYGFLAFLLCRQGSRVWCMMTVLTSGVLIALILVSRLYLGAHWLSDVLGGLSFAAAWVATLAAVYIYRAREQIGTRAFASFMAVAILLIGGSHIALQHADDVVRYAPANPDLINHGSSH